MPGVDLSVPQLEKYMGETQTPEDFQDFWKRQYGAVDITPVEVHLRPREETKAGGVACRCYDLWFRSHPDRLIYAKYVCPDTGRPAPIVVQFHDYPQASRSFYHLCRYPAVGMAVLAMDNCGQGGRTPARGAAMGAGGPLFAGLDGGVEGLYLTGLYRDALMAVKTAMALRQGIEGGITVYGEGLGGALAIVCAALEPTVSACGALYPLCCDFRRVWELDYDNGAYEGLRYYFRFQDPAHDRQEEVFRKLDYADIVNFAPYLEKPALIGTGLQDTVSPPSAQYALYHRLHGPRRHLVYPKHGHELNNFWDNEWLSFLLGYSG